MCELFAMSSLYPASISFSLEEFSRHGGLSGPHKDGWGIAYYENLDVRLFREPNSASDSPCIEFIRDQRYPSKLVISHIRKATMGEISLRNTQPFCREAGGRMHLFAHNGDLPGIDAQPLVQLGDHRPIGSTDSEYAFCHLMRCLQPVWRPQAAPDLATRYRVIDEFAALIRPIGPANFIYSDGEYIFVHGHVRTQPGREGFHPPGLYWLCRSCTPSHTPVEIPGIEMEYQGPPQKAALIATVPLTDEKWQPLGEGELLVFKNGERVVP